MLTETQRRQSTGTLTPVKVTSNTSAAGIIESTLPSGSWQEEKDIVLGIQALDRYRGTACEGMMPANDRPMGVVRLNSSQSKLRPRTDSMEKDFTTANGPKGDLKCPFAAMAANRNDPQANGQDLRSQLLADPIVAEFHAHDLPAMQAEGTVADSVPASGSVTGSTAAAAIAKCPIRFLEHHSPEEVAEFFENH